MDASKPVCFVLMPFGSKADAGGRPNIDFDAIYERAIRPAIEQAGLTPVRADGEVVGGIIHRPMFERLLLSEFAVADLTTANPNVFYELGVRHATRPRTTVTLFASHHPLPFDVGYLRSIPYELSKSNRLTKSRAKTLQKALAERLVALRAEHHKGKPVDSPLFQLLTEYQGPEISRLKTDVFRERVAYSEEQKRRLARAVKAKDEAELAAVRATLNESPASELGVWVDLFLSYRSLSRWSDMISLVDEMPAELQHAILVREQLALAKNRLKDRDGALAILTAVEEQQGATSETCGLIGRVHKDRWEDAKAAGDHKAARKHLKDAIAAYTRGFEADWRDAYPGVNAVTLMEVDGGKARLVAQKKMIPVVRYAASQRAQRADADYWDHATLLELAVLARDQSDADERLGDALGTLRASWEAETTARNLRLIHESRVERACDSPWVAEIIQELEAAAKKL